MRVGATEGESVYSVFLNQYSKQVNISHIEPSDDQQTTFATFSIIMNTDLSPEALTRDLG